MRAWCLSSCLLGHTSCPNAAGRTAAGLAAREDAIDEEKRGTWNGTPVLTWEARDPSLGDPTVPGALEPIASELDRDSRPGERGLPMFAEPCYWRAGSTFPEVTLDAALEHTEPHTVHLKVSGLVGLPSDVELLHTQRRLKMPSGAPPSLLIPNRPVESLPRDY